jgi:hypothetical protein
LRLTFSVSCCGLAVLLITCLTGKVNHVIQFANQEDNHVSRINLWCLITVICKWCFKFVFSILLLIYFNGSNLHNLSALCIRCIILFTWMIFIVIQHADTFFPFLLLYWLYLLVLLCGQYTEIHELQGSLPGKCRDRSTCRSCVWCPQVSGNNYFTI